MYLTLVDWYQIKKIYLIQMNTYYTFAESLLNKFIFRLKYCK